MKRIVKVFSVALLLSLVVNLAVNCLAAGRPQAADPIQSIRRQYAAINKGLPRHKKVKKNLSGFSLEGGELVAYFDGPAVVKIVATHFGEVGRTIEEYYYRQGKLIFVFQKEQRYDKPLSGKIVRTQESRFYFQNDRLIRRIDEGGKQVATGAVESQQKQDEYLETSSKFVDGARSKSSTIEP